MALQNGPIRETPEQINKRFGIAQDRTPVDENQLRVQADLRGRIATAGHFINENVADSPDKTTALRTLEEALMWAGKAIFA